MRLHSTKSDLRTAIKQDGSEESERERQRLTLPRASSRETTGRTAALLKVKAAAATPHTERVGLVPPLTKTPRSLSLQQQSISFHITLFHPPLKLVEKLREREVTIFRRRRKP